MVFDSEQTRQIMRIVTPTPSPASCGPCFCRGRASLLRGYFRVLVSGAAGVGRGLLPPRPGGLEAKRCMAGIISRGQGNLDDSYFLELLRCVISNIFLFRLAAANGFKFRIQDNSNSSRHEQPVRALQVYRGAYELRELSTRDASMLM